MENSFKETQRIDTIWPLSILAITMVFNWLLYFRMGYGDLSFFYISLASVGFLCLFLLSLRLQTTIDKIGVHYKMFPFHFKWQTIKWEEIQQDEIRTYQPLKEYGGWGLRYGRSGKAYTISGKNGLQLYLKNGKKVLIGTHLAQELSSFIQNIKQLPA
jgi:hypothetical protein